MIIFFYQGKGKWTAILTIDSVQKSDTEKRYLLKAKNMEGTETYEIKISTSAEPPGNYFFMADSFLHCFC